MRDKSQIVNKFNDLFTNIGSHLASNIKALVNIHII